MTEGGGARFSLTILPCIYPTQIMPLLMLRLRACARARAHCRTRSGIHAAPRRLQGAIAVQATLRRACMHPAYSDSYKKERLPILRIHPLARAHTRMHARTHEPHTQDTPLAGGVRALIILGPRCPCAPSPLHLIPVQRSISQQVAHPGPTEPSYRALRQTLRPASVSARSQTWHTHVARCRVHSHAANTLPLSSTSVR